MSEQSAASSESSLSVADLYQRCRKREQDFTRSKFQNLKLMMGKQLLFGCPLFGQMPDSRDSMLRPELDTKLRTGLWQGAKYRNILDLLRKASNRDARWFLLAWWLKSEGVCEPEDLLGPSKVRGLASKRLRGLSFTDFRHASIVHNWLPYFEELLKAMRKAKKGRSVSVDALVNAGFERDAAEAVIKKRRAVPAICDWLATTERFEGQVDAPTLRNAYSRVFQRRSHFSP
jgi:hypothetical protein